MRKRPLLSLALVIVLTLIAWLFVGFDRYVGDHEIGSSWDLFVKSKPTFQMKFKNPAQRILDFDPYETLDAARQRAFIEYCDVRWGTSDPHQCEKIVDDHRV